MEHSFNIHFANKYGIEEAIFIKLLSFWIIKNKANNKHLIDNRTWTYNSHKAFKEIFPYMNESKIKRVIESLVNQEVLIKGNYNKSGYDRTCWYAFKNEESFIGNEHIHLSKTENGKDENDSPIPVINTIKETNTYKRTNKFTPPSIEDVKDYFLINGYKEESAIKAYNFYNTADWVDSRGEKVKNWKQKMIGVWFKEENKITKTEARIKL